MGFSKKVSSVNSSISTLEGSKVMGNDPKKFKLCVVDYDSPLFRAAKFMQDDYIEVTYLASGSIKEFKNKTSFGIRSDKIIELKEEDIASGVKFSTEGQPIKWLAWTNHDRTVKGLKEFTLEDFSVEAKERLTSQHDSYEAALKSSLDTLGFNIGAIKKFMDADDYLLCIGAGEGNYRDHECKDVHYKGHRDGKPMFFNELRAAFMAQYNSKVEEAVFCEAEDLLQHYASIERAKYGYDTEAYDTCVSFIDKDCSHIGISSFNFDDFSKGWRHPSTLDCEKWLVAQTISGDPTDNITGLPSLTDKTKEVFNLSKRMSATKSTADKILEGCESTQEMWLRAVFCYQQYYGMNTVHTFKDVHGDQQNWDWLDYMQQCYVLVRMQERPNQVPCLREYLTNIGVDYISEVSYDRVEAIDQTKLFESLENCEETFKELKDKLKTYKSLSKGDLVKRVDEIVEVSNTLENNMSLLR